MSRSKGQYEEDLKCEQGTLLYDVEMHSQKENLGPHYDITCF